MNVFYHAVGKAGARRDFPKTVFARVPLQIVEQNLPGSLPMREDILQKLHQAFPDGTFDCWGIPTGGRRFFDMLEVGDAVVLMESIANGSDTAAVVVKAKTDEEQWDLS